MLWTIRLARDIDAGQIRDLIHASVRSLQADDYTPAQIDRALDGIYGLDRRLIADGTYFVARTHNEGAIIACGGWSRRRTLYGSDSWSAREDDLLDPSTEPAKIRAFFVHPDWARQGIASALLAACEDAARGEGFTAVELGATLTGVKFFRERGYRETQRDDVPIGEDLTLAVVRMSKVL